MIEEKNTALERLQSRHVFYTSIAALAIEIISVPSNFLNGHHFRALLAAAAGVCFAYSAALARHRKIQLRNEAVFLVGLVIGASNTVFSNGGFDDPRALICIAVLPIAGLAGLGTRRATLLLWLTLAMLAMMAILQATGVLAWIRAEEASAAHRYIMQSVLVVGFVFSFWMLTTTQRLQVSLLTESNREANEARQAESRFLSNMSHEIRNPLNGLLGLVRQARKMTTEVSVARHLDTALRAGDQLRYIVDDILDLKKLEAGGFRLDIEPFETKSLEKLVASIREGLLAEHPVKFVSGTDLAQIPAYLLGDPIRIAQIATNLLSNALKFTPRDGMVTATASYDHEHEILHYSVSDTGIGMSPETVASIFDRFTQAQDGTTKSFRGTGLGLAIARHLAELMGGTITVESAPGKGSTFKASIPLPTARIAGSDSVDTLGADQRLTDATDASSPLAGLRALCVDDSEINLAVLALPLETGGASVVTASSGADALEHLRSGQVDVVLTDISMPGMDGVELLREIRNLGLDLPVLAITGNVLAEDVDRYRVAGFAAVLGKPLDPEQLIASVRAVCLR